MRENENLFCLLHRIQYRFGACESKSLIVEGWRLLHLLLAPSLYKVKCTANRSHMTEEEYFRRTSKSAIRRRQKALSNRLKLMKYDNLMCCSKKMEKEIRQLGV